MGLQPIAVASTTQSHVLGTVIRARDVNYGEGEFIYLLGVALTDPGDAVCFNSKTGVTVRAVAAGATSIGAFGVAMSATVADRYGWYQISGSGPINAATSAANTQAFLTATAGQVDDTGSGAVSGLTITAATSGGFATVQMDRPAVNPSDSGTNTGDVTLTAVGSTPAAAGASLAGQVLTLQPASSTLPGLLTAGAQTIAGAKKFTSKIDATAAAASTPLIGGDFAAGFGISFPTADNSIYFRSGSNLGGDFFFVDVNGNQYGRVMNAGLNFTDVSSGCQGKITYAYTDSSASPGNATINKASGRSAIAAAATAITVTNNVCTATSIVTITPEDLDTTLLTYKCVPGSGSFVVTGVAAATANWKFRWVVSSGA